MTSAILVQIIYLIPRLVEHCTGIAEDMGSIHAWIFNCNDQSCLHIVVRSSNIRSLIYSLAFFTIYGYINELITWSAPSWLYSIASVSQRLWVRFPFTPWWPIITSRVCFFCSFVNELFWNWCCRRFHKFPYRTPTLTIQVIRISSICFLYLVLVIWRVKKWISKRIIVKRDNKEFQTVYERFHSTIPESKASIKTVCEIKNGFLLERYNRYMQVWTTMLCAFFFVHRSARRWVPDGTYGSANDPRTANDPLKFAVQYIWVSFAVRDHLRTRTVRGNSLYELGTLQAIWGRTVKTRVQVETCHFNTKNKTWEPV